MAGVIDHPVCKGVVHLWGLDMLERLGVDDATSAVVRNSEATQFCASQLRTTAAFVLRKA